MTQAQAADPFLHFLADGGGMRESVRQHDWAATPLGPIASWPQSLRTATGLLLCSPVPMVMLWGEEGVMIYNDAYSGFAGGRHPALLGSRIREGWPEVADFNDRAMRVGLAGGTLSFKDQEFTLFRHGVAERVWMDLDYSPVPDERGRPGGVIAVVVETTTRRMAERRRAALSELGDRLRETATPAAAAHALSQAALRHLGAEGVAMFEAQQDEFHRLSHAGRPPATEGEAAPQRLVAPVMRDGHLVARLLAERRGPPPWTPDEVALGLELAERGWSSIQRARAEAALRESEDHHRATVDLNPQVSWTALPEGQLDQVSPRWMEWTGTTGLGSTWSDGLHPDDRARTFEVWGHSVATGEPYDIEHRMKMRDGSYRWAHSRAYPRRDSKDAIVKWYGATEDIHVRRMAEAALRESEERFRSLADSAPALIWMTESEGRLIYANRHHERVFGLDPSATAPEAWRNFIHEADLTSFEAGFARAFAAREDFLGEVRVWDRKRRARWMLVQGVPRADGEGRFLGYVGVSIDVTEARLARDELERRVAERTAELAATNRQLLGQIEERERIEATLRQMQRLEAVGQLTSGVAHDFNNLLTVVLGNLDFVEQAAQQAGLDARSLRRLSLMRAAAQRGATLTAQLLAFSRRQRLAARPLDLNETVAGMRDLLESSMGGAVTIEGTLQPELWPALVDPTQIELVILNLAINGRDAMGAGGSIRVETANVSLGAPERPEEPAPGDYVMVAVSDTGSGMTPEVRAKAFEPFFTTKPVGKGSGLGLAQVYGFAKQSGGGVRIETAPGRGTTVRVFLPRASAPAAPGDGEGTETDGAPRRRRVLLVDDDAAVREVTGSMLGQLGCEVLEAGSGGAALDLLSNEEVPFDLVVLDYAMPGMTGAELAREIATRRPGLPVIFVTGYADEAALRELGAGRVLQKPFTSDALARILGRATPLASPMGEG
ncbi:PAS domain S-box protein [Sabulicella glaciei]|uniref:histidine kinase n=1 Tax=Sabulicella glaciei TaxID=2984948 RepID=A0ABT3NQ57_9PROT|nr:PAS domain S-box protein [Roseococcus sp. MDT2-1-1]MCW8084299.1 PAS domain S-box protein [Roseococcus sp. MDT2-1-1]